MRHIPRLAFALLSSLLLAALGGCATAPPSPVSPAQIDALLPADALLLGEQHDAPEHQQIHRAVVARLAERGLLAAVVVEMASEGASTAGVPREAGEAQVQAALRWGADGWSWRDYGPAVMAAVRAGVPVLGGNLARPALREAMKAADIDGRLDAASWQRQQDAVRDGHCGLLPEAQLPAMARVQVARDLAMAQTVAAAVRPGQAVVLLAGSAHVDRTLGVPRHLPATLRFKAVRLWAAPEGSPPPEGYDLAWRTPPVPPKDYCAEMREAFKAPAPR